VNSHPAGPFSLTDSKSDSLAPPWRSDAVPAGGDEARAAAGMQRRVALAACFGTFLEWYDFLTFATLASYFAVLFYPPDNPVTALLASLGTFGVGMVVRPIGAAFFGSLGDRIGRRKVFIVTIVLMGLATFLVGLLPTFAQVGMLAPLLLLALRLLQGLSVGGEIGGSAVYLTEHAPTARRGMFTSVLQLMGPLGMLASTLQVIALQAILTDEQFRSWGWRVPFLLSALLLAVSIRSRIALHESPVFQRLRSQAGLARAPLRECLSDRRTLGRMLLLFSCISAGGSLLFFSSQVYATVYLKNVVRLDSQTAFSLVLPATLVLFPLTILCGWLSDRVGRRPVLLAGLLCGTLCLLPVFQGLLHFGNPALERFRADVPIVLSGRDCHYGPFSQPANDCERYQELLVRLGVRYSLVEGDTGIRVGDAAIVAGFDAAALNRALVAAGWSERADPGQVNKLVLALLLLAPVVAVALITGPQTAVLAELFPARTRYSAVALPHNLSAGWIGGLSPFMVTLLSVLAADSAVGLYYPVALLAVALLIGLIFLPETRGVPLDAVEQARPPA
jgi:MFS family permease